MRNPPFKIDYIILSLHTVVQSFGRLQPLQALQAAATAATKNHLGHQIHYKSLARMSIANKHETSRDVPTFAMKQNQHDLGTEHTWI